PYVRRTNLSLKHLSMTEFSVTNIKNDIASVDEGASPAAEVQIPEGSILEKLGQRLKERSDKVHRYFQRNTKLCDVNRRLKSQIWSSVVTIVLVEGKNLLPMDIDGFSDPYAKFRLGNEKYKSKVIYKSLNPSWLEQFDLHLYDDQSQELEVTIWDKDRSKDDFMGSTVIISQKIQLYIVISLEYDTPSAAPFLDIAFIGSITLLNVKNSE
ncbi:hypothetical protein L9F63_007146, partial [Diploptera punctata]